MIYLEFHLNACNNIDNLQKISSKTGQHKSENCQVSKRKKPKLITTLTLERPKQRSIAIKF